MLNNICKQKNNIIIGVVVLIVIGSYVFFDRSQKEMVEPRSTGDILTEISTTTVNLGGGIVASVPDGYKVETISSNDSLKSIAPSLSRQISFSSDLDQRVKTMIQTKVPEIQAELKKDLTKFDHWIDLGIYHKVAGDYDGAKMYWDFAGKLAPTNFISFGNLGNMYAYQLKDMVNADKYYNQAIKNSPTQIYLYFQLAEAYRDVSKDLVKARAVVDLGLKANPGNSELLSLKESLK